MAEQFAAREEGVSFLHSSPGVVLTNIDRDLPGWLRGAMKIATPLIKPFLTGHDETGERQLFHATSGVFPPKKPNGQFGRGVEVPKDLAISVGSNGQTGSGSYLVNWNGDVTGKTQLLSEYRAKGVSEQIWEHTTGVFKRVEELNKTRGH